MLRRLGRWCAGVGIVGGIVLFVGNGWNDSWLWAYVGTWSLVSLYALLSIDDDLAKERFSPPEQSADRLSLRLVRLIALGHLVIGALDSGRLHLTEHAARTSSRRLRSAWPRHRSLSSTPCSRTAFSPQSYASNGIAGIASIDGGPISARQAPRLCRNDSARAVQRPCAGLVAQRGARAHLLDPDSASRVLRGCISAEEPRGLQRLRRTGPLSPDSRTLLGRREHPEPLRPSTRHAPSRIIWTASG